MAGVLRKQKEYDWKDSNVALFGTDADRKVKKESAETEPAWKGVLEIATNYIRAWRVNKFELERVPEDEVGQFYNGDSYVVLRVQKENDRLLYDVYFWIGKNSTADEYGTAAYKTVELDTLLDDRAVQHREVEGYETSAFKKMFEQFITLEGGHDSGFRHVIPNDYRPRLLRVHAEGKHIDLAEVAYIRKNLTSDDVYIIDLGVELIQWNGNESRPIERMKAAETVQSIKATRNRCTSRVVDEMDRTADTAIRTTLPDGESLGNSRVQLTPAIFRLSDASGSLTKTMLSEGELSKSVVDEDDVYLIQGSESLFVHVGVQCSVDEKRNAMSYAHDHLRDLGSPCHPIIVVSAQAPSKEYEEFWKQ